MKQTIQFALTIAASAAAMFAYMYEAPPEKMVQEVAQKASGVEPAPSKHDEDRSMVALKKKVDAARSDDAKEALIAEWVATYGAELDKQRTSQIEKDVQAYESFNVRFYNPVKTTCSQVETSAADGEIEHQDVCEDEYEFPRHPFYSLDNEALQTLAYGEPLAAFIIAERIGPEQPEAALGLLLHAAAISGKPGPLAFAAHETFDFYRVKRKPTIADIEMHLALVKVTKAMGGEEASSPLRVPDEVQIDQIRVDELARKLKSSMAQTQMTVTGSSSLKELFDV